MENRRMPKMPEGVFRQVAFLAALGDGEELRSYLRHAVGRSVEPAAYRAAFAERFTPAFCQNLDAVAPWLAGAEHGVDQVEERVIGALDEAKRAGLNRTGLSRLVGPSAAREALRDLLRSGRVVAQSKPTKGRPAEMFYLKEHAAGLGAGAHHDRWHDMIDPAARLH